MKESNDLVNGVGGGWSLPTEIRSLQNWQNQVKTGSYITFQRMIYASYGILNGFKIWNDIPSIYEKEVFETIFNIGYINIKKCPGTSKANPQEIRKAYISNKALLLKQIETYNPDVIIGGNTMNHFINDFDFKEDKWLYNNANYTSFNHDNKRVFIDAYHPAYFTIKEEIYCNEIISAASSGLKRLNRISTGPNIQEYERSASLSRSYGNPASIPG